MSDFEAAFLQFCWAMLFSVIYSFLALQDVMFRESRRPRGDPEVLAAQSREQYYKVLIRKRWCSSISPWYPCGNSQFSPYELSFFFSWRTNCKYSHWESVVLESFQPIFHILQKLQQGTYSYSMYVFHKRIYNNVSQYVIAYTCIATMICEWHMFGCPT